MHLSNNASLTTTILAGGLKVGGTQNFTISEVLTGTGGLTKPDTNTVTLSGANTYTGGTTVNSGTLALGGSNVLADAGAVTVNGGTSILGELRHRRHGHLKQRQHHGSTGTLTGAAMRSRPAPSVPGSAARGP